MGEYTERVRLIIETVVKGMKNSIKASKSAKNLNKNQKKIDRGAKTGSKYFKIFGKTMKVNRFQMVAAAFAARSLGNAMQSLLSPVLDVFGVFDILNEALLVVLIPVMEVLMPYIIDFANWMMGLSDETKLAIGQFILFVAVIAPLVLLITSIVLLGSTLAIALVAVVAFGLEFAQLSYMFNDSKGQISEFGLIVKEVFSKIKGFISDAATKLTEGFNSIGFGKTFDSLKEIVKGFGKTANGVFEVVWGLVTGDDKKVKKGWDDITSGIEQIISGTVTFIKNLITEMVTFLVNTLITQIDQFIINMTAWGYDAGKNFVKGFSQAINDTLKPVPIVGKFSSKVNELINPSKSSKGDTKKNNSSSLSSNLPKKNDFIWRPGKGAVSINPKDNIVGFKDSPPNIGGNSGNISYHTTYNVQVMDKYELQRMFAEHDRKMLDDVRRLTGSRV